MSNYAEQIAQELSLSPKNVQGAIELIDAGNTIPFIARYRKEATGSMDDQALRTLGDRLEYLRGLDKRKGEVESSISEQGAMTPEIAAALTAAKTLAEVEDIYRPYSPSARPVPALPVPGVCSRWRMPFWPRKPTLTPKRKPLPIAMRKCPTPVPPWPEPRTSSRN